ncbi:uncharacterized protein LOC134723658 [Mytilus trossulus]|uniref:uncharacterized protein LOC134723658 n=1 Tax=Mytilus trossulus TaxID=6551 RepID=UPI00300766C1
MNQNETSNISESTNVNPSLRLLYAVLAGIVALVNIIYIIVCFKVLRQRFLLLAVMGLCFSDAILGVAAMIFSASPVLEITTGIKEICWLQLFLLNFGLCLNYGFIFLICLQRYLTIRSYNYGTVAHFDKKKYVYVCGMIILVFLITFGVSILSPKEDLDQLTYCTAPNLYGKGYVYFVAVGLGPPVILTFLVVLLSSFSSIHLWRIYFKNRKTKPILETFTNRNTTFTEQSKRSEHEQDLPGQTTSSIEQDLPGQTTSSIEQDLPGQTTSSISWSNKQDKLCIKHLESKSQNEDNRKIHIQPQNDEDTCKTNTKVIQTVAAIDTWTVNSVSHKDDKAIHSDRKKRSIQIENKNMNTQMQTGIFVPVNNDQQQQSIFDIFEQNERADNTDDTLRNDDLIQVQNEIISIMDDCNDQSTTNEQPKNENILNCQNKTEMDDTQRIVQHQTNITKTMERMGDYKRFQLRKSWEVRAFVTSIVIAIQTILLTGPFISSFWIEIIHGSTLPLQTRFILSLLFLTNSLSNPLIYAWRIPEIRREFRNLLKRNN